MKCSGLLYDIVVQVAANSKLQSVKVQKALKDLHTGKDMSVHTSGNQGVADIYDKIDLCLRLLLAHLRQLKQNEGLKLKVFRLLSRSEQVKIDMILAKLQLDLTSVQNLEESERETPTSVEIVPWENPSPSPKPNASPLTAAGQSSGNDLDATGLPKLPAIFDKIMSKYSSGSPCSSSSHTNQIKKKKQGKCGAKKLGKMQPKKKMKAGSEPKADMSDEALLRDAMEYEPQAVMKKPSSRSKPSKQAKPMKKPSSQSKRKTPAALSDEFPAAGEAEEYGNGYKFQAKNYGECKLEMYTKKSYIRYKGTDQKWKSIVSSCMDGHHQQICRQLVGHVREGKSGSELFAIRARIMETL